MSYTFTDCIGFGGAFALGMTQAGFELKAKREIMNFGVQTCESNRHILGWDWDSQVAKMDRRPDWDLVKTDVVTGNPPCSGFSTMTSKHLRGMDASINDCMWAFASYVARTAPTIAAFESVQQAHKMGRDLMLRLRDYVEEETGKKYHLTHLYHNALDHGGPANRPRYFWVISQIPFGVEIPEPDLVPTFNDVCGDLRGLHPTWEKQPYRVPETWWSSRRRSEDGLVDGFAGREMHAWKRVQDMLDATDGWWPQGWKQEQVMKAIYERDGKLPGVWEPALPRLLEADFYQGPNQVMRWKEDSPCRVITGAALEATLHPTENRFLTHREAARIQGFTDNWRIYPVRDVKNLNRTWGKGIPVDAGRWLGYWIKQALDGNPGTMSGIPQGERETLMRADRGFKRAMDRGARRHVFWSPERIGV
jgi:site-specific DNA-cytosine methylase